MTEDLMTADPLDHRQRPFLVKMQDAGVPQQAAATFLHHLARYLEGASGTLDSGQIAPVSDLPDADDLEDMESHGAAALDRVAVIKLNGGLGTGMGLERAKSLLEVRPGVTFLDLIARQIRWLRRSTGHQVPLLVMNSFRTEQDTLELLSRYPGLAVRDLPLAFRQHRVPKILMDGAVPAVHPADPDLEWCPPGHGDLYTALATSRSIERLIEAGVDYAFASNADNLGAVMDLGLLGYMAHERIPFLMEVADRTPADRKGGHLCVLADGRLALRESAQCPADERHEFQDVTLYKYFNTNNVWFHLPTLVDTMDRYGGILPLATITNAKTLDPRDPSSARVVQLETAMGSAISLIDGALAVRVPRRRFSPVKNTNDLLAVRSDAFQLTDDWRVVLHADRNAPPVVSLDDRYFKMIEDFEARFPDGAPSLRGCEDLSVRGDVTFGAGVSVKGRARVIADNRPVQIPAGATISGDVTL
jgi:UTP--glucose-1-phosphate uridylyltransferase